MATDRWTQKVTFVDQVNQAAAEAGTTVQEVLTQEFRAFAVAEGWPADVANHCSVTHDNYEFSVLMDPVNSDIVLDWELGTIDRGPKPAMHKFMARIDEFQDSWDEAMYQKLLESGVL